MATARVLLRIAKPATEGFRHLGVPVVTGSEERDEKGEKKRSRKRWTRDSQRGTGRQRNTGISQGRREKRKAHEKPTNSKMKEDKGSCGADALAKHLPVARWPRCGAEVTCSLAGAWLLQRLGHWSELGVRGLEFVKGTHSAFAVRHIIENSLAF